MRLLPGRKNNGECREDLFDVARKGKPMNFSFNPRESHHEPPAPTGPRPKMRVVGYDSGVPVKRCESQMEMEVRVRRLRKRMRTGGDQRAAERLLSDDVWAHPRKQFRNGSKNE